MTENVLDLERRAPLVLPRPSAFDRLAREAVRRRLGSLRRGGLTLVDHGGAERFGDPEADLQATVFVTSPRLYRSLVLRGPLGGAEAFMDGHWHSDDLTAVVRILVADAEVLGGLGRGLARLARPGLALYHRLHRNTRSGSRRNVAAHYDLGNAFFERFLDASLTYSSGVFERPEATTEEAQTAKYERLCRKLRLRPDDHVLEIGSGWGGFALHAASRHGCRVTTTTVSRRQHELACRRVAAAGLADRVRVLLRDYRDLEGEYDRVVSIEMIEAVGHRHLDRFFRVCSERLRPHGVLALQAITVPDRHFATHVRSVDFIKRYIFPGGELVSVGAMGEAAARGTDLRLTHLEDLTPHYAETLRRWRVRFVENLAEIRAQGFDERFLRMWEFYLRYCEGGFEERSIGLVQAVFEKAGARRAPILGALDALPAGGALANGRDRKGAEETVPRRER